MPKQQPDCTCEIRVRLTGRSAVVNWRDQFGRLHAFRRNVGSPVLPAWTMDDRDQLLHFLGLGFVELSSPRGMALDTDRVQECASLVAYMVQSGDLPESAGRPRLRTCCADTSIGSAMRRSPRRCGSLRRRA